MSLDIISSTILTPDIATPSPLRSITGITYSIGSFFKIYSTQVNDLETQNMLFALQATNGAGSTIDNDLRLSIEYFTSFDNISLQNEINIRGTAPSTSSSFGFRAGNHGVFAEDVDYSVHVNKWLMMASTHDHTTQERKVYLIDCATGTTIHSVSVTSAFAGAVTSADYQYIIMGGTNVQNLQLGTDEYCLKAEDWLVDEVLSESDLQTISQAGFVADSHPTTCLLDLNYMLPLTTTTGTYLGTSPPSDEHFVVDQVSGASLKIARGLLVTSTDNPVEVLKITGVSPSNTSVDVTGFSVLTEDAKVVAYPANTPTPSAANVYNEVGATAASSIVFTGGVGGVTATISGLSSDTSYDIYLVQEDGASGYILTDETETTTGTSLTLALTDIDGTAHNNIADIEYAVFVGTAANALGTELDSGLVTMVGDSITLAVTGASSGDNVVVMLSKAGVEYGTYPATLS